MTSTLHGKKIAILVVDGFVDLELVEPRRALDKAGADTFIVSPEAGAARTWEYADWGDSIAVDVTLDQTNVDDYDALLLPGGFVTPSKLSNLSPVAGFVSDFFEVGKPVATICQGPWILVQAGVVKGRSLTSWPSLQSDIRNSGGLWVDQPVVVCDKGPNVLISSRKPADIPVFNGKMMEIFAKGRRQNAVA